VLRNRHPDAPLILIARLRNASFANVGQHRLDDIIIRSATDQDAALIAEIHAASWRDAYAHILAPEFLSGSIEADRLAFWSERLRDRPSAQLVNVACDATGCVQAFVCCYCDVDPVWEA
jgi:hypothetical protein